MAIVSFEEAVLPILMAVAVVLATAVLRFIFSRRALLTDAKPNERPRRHLTLRINNVPLEYSRTDFEEKLESLIAEDSILKESIKTLLSVSLVRINQHSACGTATFYTSLPVHELVQRLRGGSKGRPYKFDNEFYGITPLYEHETNARVE
jgi:hypothetical protein